MFAGARRRSNPQASTGFTLIELLVVLAISALLVALVPTAGYKLKAAMDYRAAVQGGYRVLHQARSLAIRQGVPVVVAVDLDQRSMDVAEREENVVFPDNLRLDLTVAGEVADARVGRFVFYPDGSSTGGRLTLERPSGQGTTLSVDWLTGRVHVSDSAKDG